MIALSSRLMTAVVFCSAMSITGCRDTQVSNYLTPKDGVALQAGTSGAALPVSKAEPNCCDTVSPGQEPVLAWVAPAGWQKREAGASRKATYAIADSAGAEAQLAITAFPGDVGGEVANVNRWRGQLGLATLSAAEASASLTRFEANGLAFSVVDLISSGEKPMRMLGASVPHAGSTWFFKLTGPAPLVAAEKARFLTFLTSVKPR